MDVRFDDDMASVDWVELTNDLAADDFDNGRTPDELRRSFEHSYTHAFAKDGTRVVAKARLLADGVCNGYIVDVWTLTAYRRQGIAAQLVRTLLDRVPGHHVALFTDDRADFYETLGFTAQVGGMSVVVGQWLNRGRRG